MGEEFQWVGSFSGWGVSMGGELQWVRSFNHL